MKDDEALNLIEKMNQQISIPALSQAFVMLNGLKSAREILIDFAIELGEFKKTLELNTIPEETAAEMTKELYLAFLSTFINNVTHPCRPSNTPPSYSA